MGSMIAFPAYRIQRVPAAFVPTRAALVALVTEKKDGVLVEFPARGAHFLDEVLKHEAEAKAARLRRPETMKTLMRFALLELQKHSPKQLAVVQETVFLGNSNVETAYRAGVTPASVGSYKRRGLRNLHSIFKKAEGALHG